MLRTAYSLLSVIEVAQTAGRQRVAPARSRKHCDTCCLFLGEQNTTVIRKEEKQICGKAMITAGDSGNKKALPTNQKSLVSWVQQVHLYQACF
jgi:hypothetical protein